MLRANRLTMRLIVLSLWVAVPLLAQPCRPVTPAPLPAKVTWSSAMKAHAAALTGDMLIVETADAIRALDAHSGEQRWEVKVARREFAGPERMVVTAERIYLSADRELKVLATADGSLLARATLPRRIRFIEGPPPIAVADNAPSLGSTLYVLGEDGTVRAKRIVRNVEDVWIDGGIVVARMTPNSPDDGAGANVVSGFRLRDLEQLWSFRAQGADLQNIDGRWYVGETPWSPMQPLDLLTGSRGQPLPEKEPTDVLWGGATWEIDVAASAAEGQPPCDRLRVNDPATGRPRWAVDLPFSVTTRLRDGDRFFVFGSNGDEQRFVAVLVWKTGKVVRVWRDVPMLLNWMFVDGDRLVGVGIAEGALALDVSTGPPAARPRTRVSRSAE